MSALRTRPSVDKAICRRDLASPDLWDRSLQRSRERRRIAEIHRRTAPRRKGVSLAVSAALLASPVFPRFASAHSGSSVGTPTEDTGGPGAPQAPKLLERGDTSSAVKQVQRALGVTGDGIFGPITEGAVKRFQGHEGLPRTGRVDPATWMKLFSGNVTVLEAGTPEAQAIQTAAGDDPTPPAVPAGSDPARDESATPVARPAAFQPEEEESATKSSPDEPSATRDSGDEPSATRDSGDEPRRTRRASSDDRDRTPSRRSESTGEDRDRGSTQPAPDKREDPAPPPTPAPSGGGGGGGGSCDGDFARPVNGTVTGVFGENRGGRTHEGMDIAAPSGTPIKAATCGRVTEAGPQGAYGNIICIRASESFTTCYAHMSRFGASVGQYVKIGEVIGYVGCTGSCTGPHVHFEVRLNGQKVDPAPYINGSKKAPSARSSSTMAVGFTDSTRKTREARALKREQVSRQHDEAAQDPAQQPQISTAATEGDAGQAGSSTPADPAAPTTASIDAPAAAADPSTQAADPSASVPEDTTAAVEDTGQGAAGADTGAVEETAGSTVDETTSSVEEATGTENPGTDGGAVEETTSSVEEDASSAVDETTGTDAPGSDTSGVDETTSSAEEDASSTVEETTGTVEEDASSAVEETTGAVEEATGSSDEESDAPGGDDSSTSSDAGSSSDAPGEDDSDTSSDEGSSGDSAGEDGAGSEEPAGATAGG